MMLGGIDGWVLGGLCSMRFLRKILGTLSDMYVYWRFYDYVQSRHKCKKMHRNC